MPVGLFEIATRQENKSGSEKVYRKLRRKVRKQLRAEAKNFRLWDFAYLLRFVDVIVRAWSEFYREDNLLTDEREEDRRASVCKKLVELMDVYQNASGSQEEEEAIKNLFDYMKENLMCLWD